MIIRNISFGLITSISRLILGLATFTIITKLLSVEEFGNYSYLITITGYLTIFIDFGFNYSSLNELPKSPELIKNNFYETIFSKTILTIFSLTVLFLLIFIIPSFNYSIELLLFSIIAILFSYSTYFIHVFKAFNRFDIELIFVLINNLFPLIIFFVFSEEISILTIAYIILISRIAGVLYLLLKFRFFFIEKKIVKKLQLNLSRINSNWKYSLHMIIGSFFISSDILIMKNILGFNQIAIYSAGIKILMTLLMIGEVINSSFIPKLSEYYNTSNSLFKSNSRKLFMIITIIGLAFSAGILLLGGFVIDFVFGDKYDELIPLLPYFSILLIVRFYAIFFGTMVTLFDKQKYRAFTVIFILPAHFFLNQYFQIKMGISGALVSMLISFSIITIINSIITLKFYPKKSPKN